MVHSLQPIVPNYILDAYTSYPIHFHCSLASSSHPLAFTKTSPPLLSLPRSPMSLTHLLTSGYQDMCLSPSSNILVCGVTGCGKERKGAEVGSLLLWGCWVCRAHFHAYQRAITCTSNPSHTPPQQPSHKKGRGAKPSPAAMGVTITDLAFMHAIAMEGEKDEAAYAKIKGQMQR